MKNEQEARPPRDAMRAELGRAWPYDNGHFDSPTRAKGNRLQMLEWNVGHVYLIVGILAALLIEGLVSDTALITPLPRWIAYSMMTLGVLFTVYLLKISWNVLSDMPRIRAILVSLGALCLIVSLSYYASWRIANHWEFAASNMGWQTAYYPIVGKDDGRGRKSFFERATVSINPYGTVESEVPITNAQHMDLVVEGYEQKCVAVLQRQSASGAVQIKEAGRRGITKAKFRDIRACVDVPSPS